MHTIISGSFYKLSIWYDIRIDPITIESASKNANPSKNLEWRNYHPDCKSEDYKLFKFLMYRLGMPTIYTCLRDKYLL